MGTLKKVGLVIGILLLLFIVFLCGIVSTLVPSQQKQTTGTSYGQPVTYSNQQDPENIVTFRGTKEGDLTRFYFGFDDRMAHDGKVSFKITDATNKILYNNEFSVKASDYGDYQFLITGQPVGKVYEWKVPFNQIQKGSSQWGTAYLTFTATDGKVLTASNSLVEIPQYTSQELEQIYETKYLKSAKSIGQTITKGNFEVMLVRTGYFTHLEFGEFGNEITEFRADIRVKNIGSEKHTFNTYDSAMIIGNKQYDYAYNSKFDGSNIYPQVSKEGYVIFKSVPAGVTGQVKIIVGSAWIGFDQVNYEFDTQI